MLYSLYSVVYSFDHSMRETLFSIGLQGVHCEDTSRVQEIIWNTLDTVAKYASGECIALCRIVLLKYCICTFNYVRSSHVYIIYVRSWNFNFYVYNVFREGFPEERIKAVLHQIERGIKHQSSHFGLSLISVSLVEYIILQVSCYYSLCVFMYMRMCMCCSAYDNSQLPDISSQFWCLSDQTQFDLTHLLYIINGKIIIRIYKRQSNA